ncbi:MAG: CDP-alcohol phosphatidyltransferase family protein [Bacteroidota bacterium]
MRRHLPNAITLSNLFFGVLAIIAVTQGNWQWTLGLVGLALMADFLDGLVARVLGVASPMGKELDSLADVVSFGVVPALVMAQLAGLADWLRDVPQASFSYWIYFDLIAALLIAPFSGLRLARFNLDTRQSDQFIGLPTPANAALVLSFWVISFTQPGHWLSEIFMQPGVVGGISLLLCYLLNAELPLLALKFKSLAWAPNRFRYLLIIGSVFCLVLFQALGVPLVFAWYLGLSLWANWRSKATA